MAYPFKWAARPFRAPLDGSASSTRANQGEGICVPVAPPPGGPGQNTQPFPGAPATKDTAARAAPVITTWFDDNGMAQACFPGNFTALGVGSPGQVGPPGPPGPQGNQGNPGQAATITVGNVSSTAPGGMPSITNSGSGTNAVLNFVLPQGNTGPQGATGNNGNSIQVRGSVATASALPTSGMNIGDIWIAQDTGSGFEWNGSSWVNIGQMRGVAGPPGPVGPAGPSLNMKGSVASSADLPTTGNNVNDAYITTDTGDLWVWTGSTWQNVGPITGPQGPAGPPGATGAQGTNGAAATVAVGTVTTLPAGSPATVTNAGTSLAALFNFGIPQGQTGATGNPGPTGPTGATGPAFTPAQTGTGNVFAVQMSPTLTSPTLQGPAITGGGTVTGLLTTQGQAVTGNVALTGNENITGSETVLPATGGIITAPPAANLAGGSILGYRVSGTGLFIGCYWNGSLNSLASIPGWGTDGPNFGSATFGSTDIDVRVAFAPPAAANAAIAPANVAILSPNSATFPGAVYSGGGQPFIGQGIQSTYFGASQQAVIAMGWEGTQTPAAGFLFASPGGPGNYIIWSNTAIQPTWFPVAQIQIASGGASIQANSIGGGYAAWATTWSSDRRTKENIKHAEQDALAKVLALQVYEADHVSPFFGEVTKHFEHSWMADEVEKICPHAVVKADPDNDASRDSLNTQFLVPILWQAVQQLSAKVAALEGKPPVKESTAPTPEPEPTPPQHQQRQQHEGRRR